MYTLADKITTELGILIGEPLSECWRVANMQIFGFGPLHNILNRKGEEIESCDLRVHVQCRWRIVGEMQILFGSDDLLRPANEEIPLEDFDWDKHESVLDVVQRDWFEKHRIAPLNVVRVSGDRTETGTGPVFETEHRAMISDWPLPRPRKWLQYVNEPETDAE